MACTEWLRLDGCFDLIAGALASDPDRAHASAAELGLSLDRPYADFREMAQQEVNRPDGIDAVSIVAPNHLHGLIAEAFLNHGSNVICDKPMTATLAQADALMAAAATSKAPFFLMHNYTGYPMIRQAREMVTEGALGELRVVQADYLQDWLSAPPAEDNKQTAWRMDPDQAVGGAIGDIGTHAYNLTGFVTGLHTQALSAALQGYVPGQSVDNDARVTLQYDGGARGHIWASQVAIGNENNLTLAIYGSQASIWWAQENPNILWFTTLSEAPRMITRGGGAYPAANAVTRIPSGHPEGYLEAFATLYRKAAEAILSKRAATGNNALIGIVQGLDGVRFVDAANGHQTPMRLGSPFHNSLNTRIWIVCGMRLHLGRIAR